MVHSQLVLIIILVVSNVIGIPGTIYFTPLSGSLSGPDYSVFQSNSILSISVWYHLILTFSSTQALLYINGILDTTILGNYSLYNDSTATYIKIGDKINGTMDEFSLFNYVFTQSQVTSLYQQYTHYIPGINVRDQTTIISILPSTNIYIGIVVLITVTFSNNLIILPTIIPSSNNNSDIGVNSN